MLADLIDNPTRKAIILALKTKGSLSVEDLSREVKITPMGVRQHLFILERFGIVEYITRKKGIGRPGFLYRLTDAADELFPKTYAEFTLDILNGIEETEGKGKIEELLKKRMDGIRAEKIKMFTGKTFSDRLSTLVEMIQEGGGITELAENGNSYTLKQFNCPLSKIASNFRELCAYDLDLYRELVGTDMVMKESLADGGQACVYLIPKGQDQ